MTAAMVIGRESSSVVKDGKERRDDGTFTYESPYCLFSLRRDKEKTKASKRREEEREVFVVYDK